MKEVKLKNADRTMSLKGEAVPQGAALYDVRSEPFDLYGFYKPKEEKVFKRIPDHVGENTNFEVGQLYKNTAGGRVRFTTDSAYVAIKAVMPRASQMPHMPLTGTSGFDLYISEGDKDIYYRTYMPPMDMTDGYEAVINFEDKSTRNITIHFPLYNDVTDLYIGLEEDAELFHGRKYSYGKPILYYGSSITQGGCASRPGNCYSNIISAQTNADHINLGFSGGARAEEIITDYLSTLDFNIFVSDYDHNAPTTEHLKNTHEKLFLKIRKTHPVTPVIFITKPDFENGANENVFRRAVVYQTYMNALNQGDRNVFFIDGEQLFKQHNRDACTVDGTHPNDAGFVRMAEVIQNTIKLILQKFGR